MRDKLLAIFDKLFQCYGPQSWWPGETPFEMMVGAVLTQATAWTNVEIAISQLKAADALSPQAIRRLEERELASLIYSCGYYNSKARKLKALAQYLGERFNDDINAMADVDPHSLRAELLDVYGIGEETADAILLYAVGAPIFVIDKFTRRIFARLGIAKEAGSYSALQAVFTDNLPADAQLFNEYHALIDEHGSATCRKVPLCRECCLLDICPTGQSALNDA